MPLAARPVAEMISPKVELAIGRQALATLDRVALKPSKLDRDTQEDVERRFEQFVAGEPGEQGYELAFRGGAMGPNAFALPGGIIIVTDDMVKLADNDGELMAVLAHEIGHVRGKHALRLGLQDSGIVVLVTVFAGDSFFMIFLVAVHRAVSIALLAAFRGRGRRIRVRAPQAPRVLAPCVRGNDATTAASLEKLGPGRRGVAVFQHPSPDGGAHRARRSAEIGQIST
jgi:Zn-dependent protease with chaperone function